MNTETNTKKSFVIDILEDEHKALDKIVNKVQKELEVLSVKSFDQPNRNELKILIDYFYRRLAFHFEVEENLGILPDIASVKPRFKGQVDKLFSEHANMKTFLKNIIEQSLVEKPCSTEEEVKTFVSRFEELFQTYKEHEVRETSFVMESENYDLGEVD